MGKPGKISPDVGNEVMLVETTAYNTHMMALHDAMRPLFQTHSNRTSLQERKMARTGIEAPKNESTLTYTFIKRIH
jgi:hypothetical protein